MRTHLLPTRNAGSSLGRQLFVAIAAVALGFTTHSASALEFTQLNIEDHGDETWTISGEVDVDQESGEIATIDFGGAISGESTTTYSDGTFEYSFAAPFGSVISYTASTPNDQSDTFEEELFDPNNEE